MAGRSWTPVPSWDGSAQFRTSRYGGEERRVSVVRADAAPARSRLATLTRLAGFTVVWAVASYLVALVGGALFGVESTDLADRDFRIVLLAAGIGVWLVAGLPILFGTLALRELRERATSRQLVGTVVFRGNLVTASAEDADDFRVAIDDGSPGPVPARPADHAVAHAAVEGDVVRAVVTRAGRIRSIEVLPASRPAL